MLGHGFPKILYAVLLLTCCVDGAEVPASINLLFNGGFEEWTDYSKLAAGIADRAEIKAVMDANGTLPVNWLPSAGLRGGRESGCQVRRDGLVRHDGGYSIRLENRSPADLAVLSYQPAAFDSENGNLHVLPDRRYRFSWWCKGENIKRGSGPGMIFMATIFSVHDGKESRFPVYSKEQTPEGTFAWQKFSFVLITNASARWISFSLQNRFAQGTLWYDEVEMFDLGEVVQVDTY